MRASEPSTADDTGLKEQAVTRRAYVSFGRLSDGQPGKCTESSSGHLGDFTERPFVCREPALLAGRRMVTSFSKPVRHPTGGTVRHAAGVTRFPCPVRSPPLGGDCGGGPTRKGRGGGHHPNPKSFCRIA